MAPDGLLHALSVCSITHALIFLAHSAESAEADLGFSERGANHSSGSLKQGVWGAVPPRSYRIFLFYEVQKCHLMQDLEYLIQILKFYEKELTKVVPGGVVGATLWKV